MDKWNLRQRQLVAEFLGNFALAWMTFGLIAPIFAGVENILYLMIRLILTLGISWWSLKAATQLLK